MRNWTQRVAGLAASTALLTATTGGAAQSPKPRAVTAYPPYEKAGPGHCRQFNLALEKKQKPRTEDEKRCMLYKIAVEWTADLLPKISAELLAEKTLQDARTTLFAFDDMSSDAAGAFFTSLGVSSFVGLAGPLLVKMKGKMKVNGLDAAMEDMLKRSTEICASMAVTTEIEKRSFNVFFQKMVFVASANPRKRPSSDQDFCANNVAAPPSQPFDPSREQYAQWMSALYDLHQGMAARPPVIRITEGESLVVSGPLYHDFSNVLDAIKAMKRLDISQERNQMLKDTIGELNTSQQRLVDKVSGELSAIVSSTLEAQTRLGARISEASSIESVAALLQMDGDALREVGTRDAAYRIAAECVEQALVVEVLRTKYESDVSSKSRPAAARAKKELSALNPASKLQTCRQTLAP